MSATKNITHVAGTFLVEAPASFLNGAGLSEGENRNVTVPKPSKMALTECPMFPLKPGKDGCETH